MGISTFVEEGIEGHLRKKYLKLSWLMNHGFYSLTSASSDGMTEVIFTMLGANDPEFNLRTRSGNYFTIKG